MKNRDKNMNQIAKRQIMHPNFRAISDGLFAYCVVTDYFADWALAINYQLPEIDLNTIHKESWIVNKKKCG